MFAVLGWVFEDKEAASRTSLKSWKCEASYIISVFDCQDWKGKKLGVNST